MLPVTSTRPAFGAQLAEALGVLGVLRAVERDARELRQKALEPVVARKLRSVMRPFTTASGTPRRFATRRKLGQISSSTRTAAHGIDAEQEAAHDEREVEREAHDGRVRVEAPRDLEAGRRHRADHDVEVGARLAQLAHESLRGLDLADRHAVHEDARVVTRCARPRQPAAEPAARRGAEARRRERAHDPPRRWQDDRRDPGQVVERVERDGGKARTAGRAGSEPAPSSVPSDGHRRPRGEGVAALSRLTGRGRGTS
jgi:hypothetical protein